MKSFQDLSEDVKEEPASPENGDSETCNTGTEEQFIRKSLLTNSSHRFISESFYLKDLLI